MNIRTSYYGAEAKNFPLEATIGDWDLKEMKKKVMTLLPIHRLDFEVIYYDRSKCKHDYEVAKESVIAEVIAGKWVDKNVKKKDKAV